MVQQRAAAPLERVGFQQLRFSAIFLTIRVSGVLLAVLALGHFGMTHIINDVAETDSSFITRRWGSALWLVWDALLLVAALLHAGLALVAVVGDYRPATASRRRWLRALAAIIVTLFIVGLAVLLSSTLSRP